MPPGATRFALPKDQRIAKRIDFKKTYEDGRKFFGKHVVVFSLPNELGISRLGITATKKIGKSHDRNLLKRWVRELYRTHRLEAGLDRVCLDIVVNLKSSARGATFEEFGVDLTRMLRKVATSTSTPQT